MGAISDVPACGDEILVYEHGNGLPIKKGIIISCNKGEDHDTFVIKFDGRELCVGRPRIYKLPDNDVWRYDIS